MIRPGATLGVFGGGQLGRMFASAAHQMGYRVCVFSPEPGSPAGMVAEREFVADYDDESALAEFARSVAAVTFEFENVPAGVARTCERFVPVRPGENVLHICQHRLREKNSLLAASLPVPRFAAARSPAELARAAVEVGLPGIVKTASSGYDGKGQAILRDRAAVESVWRRLDPGEVILEELVPFEKELSVVGVRGEDGETAFLGPFENDHSNHILDVTRYPAAISPQTADEARDITRCVLESLEVVGVLCVEMFLKADGSLLVNELAPRPHNSGHLTIEAFAASQFEQQARALAGLPLSSTRQRRPAAMANLLGELWSGEEPNWPAALAQEEVSLHLYGKQSPRPGRKMGHLTGLADDVESAARRVLEARYALAPARR